MENNSSKREELIQKIQEFRLLDDDFMSRVFDENIECTELILRIILDKPDIKVSEVHTQREITISFRKAMSYLLQRMMLWEQICQSTMQTGLFRKQESLWMTEHISFM